MTAPNLALNSGHAIPQLGSVTSKLNNGFHRPDDARRAFDGTLEALGSDYVDLFLIHWPLPTLFPKSTTPARIKENFEIFDLELEPDDIAAISALDRGEEGRTGPNPDVFAYVPR